MINPEWKPPSAPEIERRFRSPAVSLARQCVLGSLGMLRGVRNFRWQASGLHHFRSLEQPLIFAANHQSHVDTAAILGTLGRSISDRTAVAAALDVYCNGGNGTAPSIKGEFLQLVVAAGFHAFAFDRNGSPLRSLRTAAELIRNGWSLLLYPEGTRSRTGEIAPFKAGVGFLARYTRRPVVPIHVEGGREVLPYGKTLPGPGLITVSYGAPLWHERRETLACFSDRLQKRVRELQPQGRGPNGRALPV